MKKIFIFIATMLIGGLIWYLFIKPFDYLVQFNTNTTTGVVNQTIKAWSASVKNSEVYFSDNLNILNQKIVLGDNTYNYKWVIESTSDTTSSVEVFANEKKNNFLNRVKIPFSNTVIEKKVLKNVSEFNKYLMNHVKNFRVREVTQKNLPAKFVAYTSFKTTQLHKVVGMMEIYPYLDNIMATNAIKPNGLPFIQVTYWNMQNDSIYYDFCYPIIQKDTLPILKDIKYREFTGGKMLQTEYNGNYITSDRAWYKLINSAKNKNIPIEKLPIEVYYTNPNFGGNELDWKAEIFVPIKE